MVAVLSILIFAGAFVVAAGTIALTIAPQWQRILRMIDGQVEESFAPLAHLAVAEHRIAVRRWAAQPATVPIRRARASA